MMSEDFGIIKQSGDNHIHYYVGDEEVPGVNCHLIFNNGLLKSIKMNFYTG
ncbi:MAG: hypothetical protein FWD26_08145 [Treponema sp.]|nr:hypothetical protein [Treponema sp.]